MFPSQPIDPRSLFVIAGECERSRGFTYQDLADIHAYYQVKDVSTMDERLGAARAVRLRKLIDLAGPACGTHFLTVESADPALRACLPLVAAGRTALIVYEKDGKPLTHADGGPARLVIPFLPHAVANVRGLRQLLVSREPTGPVVNLEALAPAT